MQIMRQRISEYVMASERSFKLARPKVLMNRYATLESASQDGNGVPLMAQDLNRIILRYLENWGKEVGVPWHRSR